MQHCDVPVIFFTFAGIVKSPPRPWLISLRDWNSRYHLTHRYIQALCAAVFLAISRRSVFEFHLSVTKECVFHSPTPAPPETAAGSHKNSILWCIFQLLSSEKLPFFLFSIFHHVLQRRLCSHDIDTWKCLAGKLLDPFFHPLFKQVFSISLISDLGLSYVISSIRWE